MPVILLAGAAAMVLQALAARLGIATGRDLAQACADAFPPPVRVLLWAGCELAICACDLAELLGAALALKLLFHIPLLFGVCLTALDVLVLFLLRRGGFKRLEALVICLLGLIGACFALELAMAQPSLKAIVSSLAPSPEIVRNPEALYLAIGIIGATVMPHNLYLHSAVVQTRRFDLTTAGRRRAASLASIDSSVALALAVLVNAAILMVAAAAFHFRGHGGVAEIEDAYRLLTPLFGPLAAGAFGLALLAAGQSSTITATLAGQVVMEGFLNLRMSPWLRRFVTRMAAVVPAIVVLGLWGETSLSKLLIGSQVVLSLQLPFAIVPLLLFTSDARRMGVLASRPWLSGLGWGIAGLIIVLDLILSARLVGPLS